MRAPQRFTHRLILFTLGSITLVFGLFMVHGILREQELLEQGLKTKLMHIATTAAQVIPPNVHESIQGPKDPAFRKIRSLLRRIKKANHLKTEIYTLVRDPEKKGLTRFVVMTNKKPFYGDPYPETEGLKRTFETGTPQTSSPYRDEFGTWISAYAPILSEDGKVLAVLEVDEKEDRFATLVFQETGKDLLLGLAILGLMVPFVLRFGRSLSHPIRDLHRMVRRIQNGKPFVAPPDSKIREIQDLKNGLSNLAHVVADRQQLIQEKLQTLEETDTLRRNLITMVSHELKTPLTGIVAAAEFLATIELDEEERLEFTQDLLLQSHSLASILDRLIQFSALQAKPLPNQVQDLSLQEELEECLEILRRETSGTTIQVHTLGFENAWIRGEKTRVRRALLEILKNAKEHSPPSRPIQLEAHRMGERIELRIRDEGSGISEETRKTAFSPLSQGGKMLVGKKAGLGMGLPLAKLSLEGIGAFLEIESSGPEGTTILIRFLAGTPLLRAPTIVGESEKNPIP